MQGSPWASSHRLVGQMLWPRHCGHTRMDSALIRCTGLEVFWAASACKARTIKELPTEVALIRQGLDG